MAASDEKLDIHPSCKLAKKCLTPVEKTHTNSDVCKMFDTACHEEHNQVFALLLAL